MASRPGRPIDRAVLESFFKSFKLNRSVRDKLTRLAKDTNGDAKRVIRKLWLVMGLASNTTNSTPWITFWKSVAIWTISRSLTLTEFGMTPIDGWKAIAAMGLLSRERVEQLIAAIASILPASDESFDERGFPIASAGSRRTEDPP